MAARGESMSDEYYRERARQRTRRLWIVGGIASALLLALFGARSLLYDACTQSYDRSPRSVALTYVTAVSEGSAPLAQECWEHNAYYDMEAGCSQICLSRAYGTQFEVTDISVGGQYLTPDVRTNRLVKVSIRCAEGGASHQGEILLDSVGPNLPWKHWQIVQSNFGGTVAEPWCQ
jgi:hypothetical protein